MKNVILIVCLLGYCYPAMAIPKFFTEMGFFGVVIYIALVAGLLSLFNNWRARRRVKSESFQELQELFRRKAESDRKQREYAEQQEKANTFYVDPEGKVKK